MHIPKSPGAILFLILLLAACAPATAAPREEATDPSSGFEHCPVTRRPQTAFLPPAPWPAEPPTTGWFWYGQPELWTALPESGVWQQLRYGEKFWWWSENFDVREDSTPDLKIAARQLGGEGLTFNSSKATNGFHESFNLAMLVGVQLPAAGCWEISGQFQGAQLKLVVWVPSGTAQDGP